MITFLSLALSGIINRLDSAKYVHPSKVDPKELTVLVWKFNYGFDDFARSNLDQIVELVNNSDADIIALFDTDASRPHYGSSDVASWLREHFGLHVDPGPASKHGTSGCLLLSKYRIISSKRYLLPDNSGDNSLAIRAAIDFSGTYIDVVMVYDSRSGIDTGTLVNLLPIITTRPLLFLGYISSQSIEPLLRAELKDVDSVAVIQENIRVLYRGMTRYALAELTSLNAVNRDPVVAKFWLQSRPRDDDMETMHSAAASTNDEFSLRFPRVSVNGSFAFKSTSPIYFTAKKQSFSTRIK